MAKKHKHVGCSCQNKIAGMKKKHRVSGMNSDQMVSDLLQTYAPSVGIIAAYEAKDMFLPKLYKDGATAEEKKSTDLYVNLALMGLSTAAVLLTPKEYKPYVSGLASGIIGESVLSLYFSQVKGVANPTIAGWDNEAYSLAAPQKQALARHRVNGLDNAAPSLLGDQMRRIDELGAPLPNPGNGM